MNVIPTAEELEALFSEGRLERVGMGSRRACYRIPGVDGLCLKCYRSDEEMELGKNPSARVPKPLDGTVIREILACRFDERRNTCCQEYRYWKKLMKSSDSSLKAYLPSVMEMVKVPSRGWCLIEEFMANDDGTPVVKFLQLWRNADEWERRTLSALLDGLEECLVRNAVRFFDPQTVMVQRVDGHMCLRIPDFEPATRTLVPLDTVFTAFVRMKVRRRFRRFRETREVKP